MHKRWDIEVFFKILKHNFKFENLRITNVKQNTNPYDIHNIKILIICILSKIFDKTYEIVNNVKLTGEIKKRKYLNKKIKNKVPSAKKGKKINKKKDDATKDIIDVDITNNKKVCIKKEDIVKNNNDVESKSNTKIENTKNKINDVESKPDAKIENIVNDGSRKCILKTNKSMSIKGVYKMLFFIINGTLTTKIMTTIFSMYIIHNKVDTTLKNKRIYKTPFKKWYVKGYTNKSDFNKIISFILEFTKIINKNLKTLSNSITIIKINYID